MSRRTFATAGLVFLVSLLACLPVRAQEGQAVVRALLFYSETCPSCRTLRREVIPALYRKYGQRLCVKAVEITRQDAHYRWMEDALAAYKVPESEAQVPILFIGERYLTGPEIEAELPELVEQGFAAGGIDFPPVPAPEGAPAPTAQFMFFFSPSCPHCRYVEESVFPRIQAIYGERVTWEAYDTSQEVNYRALLGLGELAGLPADARGAVPVVFIGDEYSLYSLMLGSAQAESYLPPALAWFMDIGGVGRPGWADQLFELAASPIANPTSTPTEAVQHTPTVGPTQTLPTTVGTQTNPTAGPTQTSSVATPTPNEPAAIHMAYFAEVGCSECDRVGNLLQVVQNRYPSMVIHEFDLIEDFATSVCLSEALGVPEAQRHDAPTIFVGDDFLVDEEIQLDPLITILERYAESGAEPVWEWCGEDVEIPPPAPWWGVIVPGLVDGINPCAFATIVFFVSYLTLIERKGREILLVGAAFTVAVFLSYLGFGLLLRQVLASLIDLVGPILKPILNVLTALACVVLAVLSLADYRKARRGRTRQMSLRLPDRLRRWINRTIRGSMNTGSFSRMVVGSFLAGVVVSFVELTCTGQVYAPIILGLSNPTYQGRALLSLIVYCVAFVMPLVVVFVSTYMGTGSRQLGAFLQRHTATVKLVTAVLFIAISVWLLYDVLRVWGLIRPLMA